MTYENDGRFPEDGPVLVRFPVTAAQEADREEWPWVPGTILGQCGPDEWHVVIDGRDDLAEPDPDAPADPAARLYPACFRDSSELRRVSESEWEQLRVRIEEPR